MCYRAQLVRFTSNGTEIRLKFSTPGIPPFSVIDDGNDQWHSRLRACILATGGHFEYSS